MLVETIRGEKTILRGVSQMFYQEGLPISIIAEKANNEGYKISWLHFADDLLKQGWKPARVISRLKEEVEDSAGSANIDMKMIEKFVYLSYEDQREMIFNYLWVSKDAVMSWFKSAIGVS